VAIYRENVGFGTEVVMVSELVAGFYRYIMEWRFAPDGTIRPRYGFGAVENACVCAPHTHHVYWRFDFDIVTPNNKIFQVERGRKFLTPITTEAAIFRKYQTNRSFLIQNSTGDEAYQITPNVTDGMVTDARGVLTNTFGAGDFWFLRFKGTADSPEEIDDPNPNTADLNLSFRATLEPWVNGESLVNQDAVVWYGAHDYHAEEADRNGFGRPEVIQGKHVVGPDLRPVRW
jgi:Cu2+-containing amine oxidase